MGSAIVYPLGPDSRGNWKERVIHTFTGGLDVGYTIATRKLPLLS